MLQEKWRGEDTPPPPTLHVRAWVHHSWMVWDNAIKWHVPFNISSVIYYKKGENVVVFINSVSVNLTFESNKCWSWTRLNFHLKFFWKIIIIKQKFRWVYTALVNHGRSSYFWCSSWVILIFLRSQINSLRYYVSLQ